MDAMYSVATDDFLANMVPGKTNVKETGVLSRDLLIETVRLYSPLKPPPVGRILLLK
ncbi:MAG: hypothetical protein ABIG11_04965 [bacterium]